MTSQKTPMTNRLSDELGKQIETFSDMLKGKMPPKPPKPPKAKVLPSCDLGLVQVSRTEDGGAVVIVHGYHHTESARLTRDQMNKLRMFLDGN